MNTDQLHYAGFTPRFKAAILDLVILLPFFAVSLWGAGNFRLFSLYSVAPSTMLMLFYYVYLVRRYGGTPGKLLAGIRIRRVDGAPIGYREAVLRYLPEFVLGLLTSLAYILAADGIPEAEFAARAFMQRVQSVVDGVPSWFLSVDLVQNVWVWGELAVLLTNHKRRALHDFVAGTVVVHVAPAAAPAIVVPAAASIE